MGNGGAAAPGDEEDKDTATGGEDQIIGSIGEWGRWQAKWFLVLCFVALPGGFPSLGITFMSADTDFWCTAPDGFGGGGGGSDLWRNLSSPLITEGGKEVRDQCSIWNTTDFQRPPDNETRACTEWTHDRSLFTNTIVQDFNLVCARESWKNVAQMVYFFGLIFGVFGAGLLSDRFGRKATLGPIGIALGTVGLIAAAMPSVEAFVAVRFVQGIFAIGVFTNAFVWAMEIVGGKWQTIIGIGCEGPWVVCWFTLALLAYIFPNWRHLMIATMIPTIALSFLAFLLPESPKWQLVTGKLDLAEKTVREAMKVNGKPAHPDDWHLKPVTKSSNTKANLLTLFKTPNMAKKTLILYFNWFANSFVYYGLTLNSGNLGGSVMVNFLLNGATEIPAYAFSLYILLRKGRKLPYSAFMILGGIFLFLTIIIPRDAFPYNWPIVMMAILGKMCITATFAIIYLYSCEIYPTVVRSVGVSSSSVFARIGGGVAPFVGSLDKVVDPSFPIVIFGVTAFAAGVLALFLPETQHRKMPDTIEDGEAVPVSLRDGFLKGSKVSAETAEA